MDLQTLSCQTKPTIHHKNVTLSVLLKLKGFITNYTRTPYAVQCSHLGLSRSLATIRNLAVMSSFVS